MPDETIGSYVLNPLNTSPKQDSVRPEAILDNWSEHPWANGLQVERLQDMEKLEVRTRNSLYEITIIDGLSGEILVRGGRFFPELTPANLQGATLGGSICKLRGIYEGFRMEINANGERAVTTPVESIEVLAELERDCALGGLIEPHQFE